MVERSRRIVVAMTDGFDIYHTLILNGARAVLEEHGVSLLVQPESETLTAPVTLRSVMRMPTICGAILFCPRTAERDRLAYAPLAALGLPVVRIGQDIAGQACVRADNAQGMTELMDLVLDQCGARHPALVRLPYRQPDLIQREEIFRAEVIRRGLAVDEDRFTSQDVDLDGLRQETVRLLERRPDTDAMVCMHDWCALMAIEGCLEAGKRVPQDVVVTGFDNFPMPSITWPGVTTVDQNLGEQGATAARIILDGLAGPHVRDHVMTKCEVIARGSTAVRAARDAVIPRSVEHVARLASEHLKAQDELDRLDQALMRCRTLDDIRRVLPESFAALGIIRAFLVVYEDSAEPPAADSATGGVARLALDFRDGRTHPVPEATFDSNDLLPEHLCGELYRGFLAVQPLESTERPLGHLLLDLWFGPVPIIANIESVLNRTLQVVSSIEALSEHSQMLERLVAQRSQDLMSEISMRQGAERDLRRANATLRRLETTDGLTGVANRRALERHFAKYWPRHLNEHRELTILLVDVDHFKAYNDQYGHLNGDKALRTVATCLSRSARYPDDLICRFGGEEFAVVLPFSGEAQGLTVAQRFVRLLADAAIPHDASPVAPVVTASIGLAAIVPTVRDTPDRLIGIADRALYQAKHDGRNRIVTGSTGAATNPVAPENPGGTVDSPEWCRAV